eukprot:12039598-Karenia_brevis.AAC.1
MLFIETFKAMDCPMPHTTKHMQQRSALHPPKATAEEKHAHEVLWQIEHCGGLLLGALRFEDGGPSRGSFSCSCIFLGALRPHPPSQISWSSLSGRHSALRFLWWPNAEDADDDAGRIDLLICREVLAWMDQHDDVLPQEYAKPTAEQQIEYNLARRYRDLRKQESSHTKEVR